MSSQDPSNTAFAMLEIGVLSVFNSTINAPLDRAACANEAAGCTNADVPITKNNSQRSALMLACITAFSIDSPNQITAGLAIPQQLGHKGDLAFLEMSLSSHV